MTATTEPQTTTHVTSPTWRSEHGVKYTPLSIIGGFFMGLVSGLVPTLIGAFIAAMFVGFIWLDGFYIVLGVSIFVGTLFHWHKAATYLSTPEEHRKQARLELYPSRIEKKAAAQAAASKKEAGN